jgi:GNAT superfamily N-acetyltransferase
VSELELRSVERRDVDEVLALFRRVFDRDLSPAYYDWQYFDTPFGGGHCQGAWLGGKLVAHIGYTPRPGIVNGRPGRILASHTAMSDPDFRGKGYYASLVSWALARLAAEGWDLVMSRPNRNSHPVHMMLAEYVDVALLPALSWQREGTTSASAAVALDERFKPCTGFGDEYERLCEAAPGRALYAVRRSAGYLSWRYCRHPLYSYFVCERRTAGKLESSVVAKLHPQDKPVRINIVEWLGSDEDRDAAEWPIRQVLDLAARHGIEVQLWHSVHDRVRRHWLERLGFTDSVPIFFFGLYPLQGVKRLGPCTDFRNWYTTMGDNDVF